MTTNNTTFTSLKANFTLVEIKDLRRIVFAWRRDGITPAQHQKMEQLLFGETAWMNTMGVYPRNYFYEIAQTLKFKTASNLLDCVKRCKGFGFVWSSSEKHDITTLLGFFTPMWFQPPINGKKQLPRSLPEWEGIKNNYIINIIYNQKIYKLYISYNHVTAGTTAGTTAEGRKDLSLTDAQKETATQAEQCDLRAEVENFIKYLVSDQEAYSTFTILINQETERLLPQLHQDSQPVNPATRLFLDHYLKNHCLSKGAKMFGKSRQHKNRLYWLVNLFKHYKTLQSYCASAVEDIRKETLKDPGMLIRQNRPLGEHEYQDPESGLRLYDTKQPDGTILQHRIPSDAPTRPSETAVWNKFAKIWKV